MESGSCHRRIVSFAADRSRCAAPFFFRFFYFFNGRFIIGNDYVRMYVTLVDSSWVVVASVLTGVDFIPLKLLRIFLFSYFSTGDLLSVTPKNIVFLPTLPFAQKKKNQKTRRRHEVEQ